MIEPRFFLTKKIRERLINSIAFWSFSLFAALFKKNYLGISIIVLNLFVILVRPNRTHGAYVRVVDEGNIYTQKCELYSCSCSYIWDQQRDWNIKRSCMQLTRKIFSPPFDGLKTDAHLNELTHWIEKP